MADNPLSKIYFAIEDQYYNIMDFFDQKLHLPVYKMWVEPIESKRVPSFPIALLLLLVIGFGIFSIFGAPQLTTISFAVKDASDAPISGVQVSLMLSDQFFKATLTDESGIATFSEVPVGAQATFKLSKDGYKQASKTTLIGEAISLSIVLESEAGGISMTARGFNLKVLDPSGNPIAGINILFLAGVDSKTVATSASGDAMYDYTGDAEVVQVTISEPGYKKITNRYRLSSGQATITLQTSEGANLANARGTITVNVKSKDGPLTAIVHIYAVDSMQKIVSKSTSSTGAVKFDSLELATSVFLVVKDKDDNYMQYNGKEKNDVFAITEETQRTITLEAKSPEKVGKINLIVVDSAGKSVSVAETHLYSMSTHNEVDTKKTDANGTTVYEVASGQTYYATAYKKGLLPDRAIDLEVGKTATLTLTAAATGNNADVTVLTFDEYNVSQAGVKVELWDANAGYRLGIPIQTTGGVNGSTTIKGVPLKWKDTPLAIRAFGMLGARTGISDILAVAVGMDPLIIKLDPEMANLTINVKDFATGKPIAANISAIGDDSEEEIGSCKTTAGDCTMRVKAGVEFTLFVVSDGYIDFTSTGHLLALNEKKNITLTMYPLSFRDISLVLDESAVIKPARDTPLEFTFNFPSGFDEAGFFVLIGSREYSLVEQGYGFVKDNLPVFTNTSIIYSTTYSPGPSCKVDLANTQPEKGLVKWVQYTFKGIGTHHVALPLRLGTSTLDDFVTISYRSFGIKNGTYFRIPEDEELGTLEKTKEIDSCYAYLEEKQLPVTSQDVSCQEGICLSAEFKPITEYPKPAYIDNFTDPTKWVVNSTCGYATFSSNGSAGVFTVSGECNLTQNTTVNGTIVQTTLTNPPSAVFVSSIPTILNAKNKSVTIWVKEVPAVNNSDLWIGCLKGDTVIWFSGLIGVDSDTFVKRGATFSQSIENCSVILLNVTGNKTLYIDELNVTDPAIATQLTVNKNLSINVAMNYEGDVLNGPMMGVGSEVFSFLSGSGEGAGTCYPYKCSFVFSDIQKTKVASWMINATAIRAGYHSTTVNLSGVKNGVPWEFESLFNVFIYGNRKFNVTYTPMISTGSDEILEVKIKDNNTNEPIDDAEITIKNLVNDPLGDTVVCNQFMASVCNISKGVYQIKVSPQAPGKIEINVNREEFSTEFRDVTVAATNFLVADPREFIVENVGFTYPFTLTNTLSVPINVTANYNLDELSLFYADGRSPVRPLTNIELAAGEAKQLKLAASKEGTYQIKFISNPENSPALEIGNSASEEVNVIYNNLFSFDGPDRFDFDSTSDQSEFTITRTTNDPLSVSITSDKKCVKFLDGINWKDTMEFTIAKDTQIEYNKTIKLEAGTLFSECNITIDTSVGNALQHTEKPVNIQILVPNIELIEFDYALPPELANYRRDIRLFNNETEARTVLYDLYPSSACYSLNGAANIGISTTLPSNGLGWYNFTFQPEYTVSGEKCKYKKNANITFYFSTAADAALVIPVNPPCYSYNTQSSCNSAPLDCRWCSIDNSCINNEQDKCPRFYYSGCSGRYRVNVNGSDSSTLHSEAVPLSYTANVTSEVACSDAKMAYIDTTTGSERFIDTDCKPLDSSNNLVFFSVQKAITSGRSDANYYLYNCSCPQGTICPPTKTDKNKVYLIYEDFSSTSTYNPSNWLFNPNRNAPATTHADYAGSGNEGFWKFITTNAMDGYTYKLTYRCGCVDANGHGGDCQIIGSRSAIFNKILPQNVNIQTTVHSLNNACPQEFKKSGLVYSYLGSSDYYALYLNKISAGVAYAEIGHPGISVSTPLGTSYSCSVDTNAGVNFSLTVIDGVMTGEITDGANICYVTFSGVPTRQNKVGLLGAWGTNAIGVYFDYLIATIAKNYDVLVGKGQYETP